MVSTRKQKIAIRNNHIAKNKIVSAKKKKIMKKLKMKINLILFK